MQPDSPVDSNNDNFLKPSGLQQRRSTLLRKVTICKDDPFAQVFVPGKAELELKKEAPTPSQIEAKLLQKKFTQIQKRMKAHLNDQFKLTPVIQNSATTASKKKPSLESTIGALNLKLDRIKIDKMDREETSSLEESSIEESQPMTSSRRRSAISVKQYIMKKPEPKSKTSARRASMPWEDKRPKQKAAPRASISKGPVDLSYKNKAYYSLPENVRKAIDVAKQRSQHSDFYYRLQNLTDKIYIFRSIFYDRIPHFQKTFLEKKKRQQEEQLQKEKEQFAEELKQIEIRLEKKIKRDAYSSPYVGHVPLKKKSESPPLGHNPNKSQFMKANLQPVPSSFKRSNSSKPPNSARSARGRKPLTTVQQVKKSIVARNMNTPLELEGYMNYSKIIEEEQDSKTRNSEPHESTQSNQGTFSQVNSNTPDFRMDTKRLNAVGNTDDRYRSMVKDLATSQSSSDLSGPNRDSVILCSNLSSVDPKFVHGVEQRIMLKSYEKSSKSKTGTHRSTERSNRSSRDTWRRPKDSPKLFTITIPQLKLPITQEDVKKSMQNKAEAKSATQLRKAKRPMSKEKGSSSGLTIATSYQKGMNNEVRKFIHPNHFSDYHHPNSVVNSRKNSSQGSRSPIKLKGSSSTKQGNLTSSAIELRKKRTKKAQPPGTVGSSPQANPFKLRKRSNTQSAHYDKTIKTLFKKKKTQIDGILGMVKDIEQVDSIILGETKHSSLALAERSRSSSSKQRVDEPLFDSAHNIIIRQPNMRVTTPARKLNSSMASDIINPLHSASLHEDPNILLIDNASMPDESNHFQSEMGPPIIDEDHLNFNTEMSQPRNAQSMQATQNDQVSGCHEIIQNLHHSQSVAGSIDSMTPLQLAQTLAKQQTIAVGKKQVLVKSAQSKKKVSNMIREQRSQVQTLLRNKNSTQQSMIHSSLVSQPYTSSVDDKVQQPPPKKKQLTVKPKGTGDLLARNMDLAKKVSMKRTFRETAASSMNKTVLNLSAVIPSLSPKKSKQQLHQHIVQNQYCLPSSEMSSGFLGSSTGLLSSQVPMKSSFNTCSQTVKNQSLQKHRPYAETPNIRKILQMPPSQSSFLRRRQMAQENSSRQRSLERIQKQVRRLTISSTAPQTPGGARKLK